MPKLSTVISVELPSGGEVAVTRRRFGAIGPDATRVAIVAGIRGDAPEGIRVAHRVATLLAGCEERLNGLVDIYPCANPLAAHRGTRRWPFFEVDLNRLFPGKQDGHPPDRVADALVTDIRGADHVIELRGARAAFHEVSQAHIRARDEQAARLAMESNVRLVWARTPGPAAPSTFAHQFVNTIVLEGGTGNRLTAGVGMELADGVMNLLLVMGVLHEEDLPFHWASLQRPVLVEDGAVHRVRAERGGLFLPGGEPWSEVEQGAPLGQVVDPATGDVLEDVASPVSGRVVAVREHPVVYPGTMVARVVTM